MTTLIHVIEGSTANSMTAIPKSSDDMFSSPIAIAFHTSETTSVSASAAISSSPAIPVLAMSTPSTTPYRSQNISGGTTNAKFYGTFEFSPFKNYLLRNEDINEARNDGKCKRKLQYPLAVSGAAFVANEAEKQRKKRT